MTKPASPKYTVGQHVEVLAFDFETPGFPAVWMPGTVTAVEPMASGRWDVEITRANGKPPLRQIVGKRGGNRCLRVPHPSG